MPFESIIVDMILELALTMVLKSACTPAPTEFPGEVASCVEDAPIVPLVCGVNLDCSDVDRLLAPKPKAAAAKKAAAQPAQSSHRVSTTTGPTGTTKTTSTTSGGVTETTTVRHTAKGTTTTHTRVTKD